MTPSRYLVIQCGDAWAIRSGNRTFGPFSDRIHAIDAAIDFAEKDGKAGLPAKVLMQEDEKTLRTVWTYGRDPYRAIPQMAGPTEHIGCHDPFQIPSELRGHRIQERHLSWNWPKRIDLDSD